MSCTRFWPCPESAEADASRAPWRRWPRSLAAVLLAAALVAGCDSPEEKAARHLERGIALLEEGSDAKAMVELQNVLRLDPKNADALHHAGMIHERAGRLPQAYAAYQQAANERPGFVAANANLGALALAGGELDAAARAAEAIEGTEPGNPDALAIRGSIALRRGDTQAALDLASRALEAAPQHENAVAVLAGVYSRLGETGRAVARLDEAIAANPETVALRILKIILLEQANAAGEIADIEAISRTYEELFALEPENALHRLALADFHRRRGDVAGAQEVLRTALHEGIEAPHAAAGFVRLVYQERGFDAAVAELKGLIERDPDGHTLRFLLANLYASEKRSEDAEKTLAEVIARVETGPVADDARAATARVRLAAGDKEGARRLAEEVLAENGEHRDANLVLGTIFLGEGRLDEAIRSGRSALRQEPTWLPALRLVAEAHLKKGETTLAIDALRQIVELDPNDARYAGLLARLLTEQGDDAAALKLWDRVAGIGDDPTPALRARAEIEMRRRNFSAAQADIDRLLGTPGQELTGALLAGDLMLLQGRFDEGREWFARAAAMNPEAPHPVLGVARAYVAAGDADGALASLERRAEEHPDDAVAFDLLGGLLARLGRLDEAEAALREAMRLRPDWLVPYRQLGGMLREGGEEAEAVEVYRAALEQDPDDPGVLFELAMALYAGGDMAEAIATYERLMEVLPDAEVAINNYGALVADYAHEDPERLARALDLASRFRTRDDANLLDTLGWLHYRNGDFPVATTFLERAALLAPENPQIRYHLGMALHRSGRDERALTELGKAVPDGADYPGLVEARATFEQLRAATGAGAAAAGTGG